MSEDADEVAKIIVEEGPAPGRVKQITGMDFMKEKYTVGSVVHCNAGRYVAERELFVGVIRSFRLKQLEESKEKLKRANAQMRDEAWQTEMARLQSRTLQDSEVVEAEIMWLPEDMPRQEESSWIAIGHVSEERPLNAPLGTTFADLIKEELGEDIQPFEWSKKAIAVDLTTRAVDGGRVTVHAKCCEGSDIIYSCSTNVHHALLHYLQTNELPIAAEHKYHLLRVVLPPSEIWEHAEGTEAVDVTPDSHEAWQEAYTFRAVPEATLTVRRAAEGDEMHPAVAAVTAFLTSSRPKPALYVEYTEDESDEYVRLRDHADQPNPRVVHGGQQMAPCKVQIHDQNATPITAMPCPARDATQQLVMMQKLKLRRVQLVRLAEPGGEWHPIVGESTFKAPNTWDFRRSTHPAMWGNTGDTFRVPKGVTRTAGRGSETENLLEPFRNACLHYKIEMVALLVDFVKGGEDLWRKWEEALTQPARSCLIRYQSCWKSVVHVEPDSSIDNPTLRLTSNLLSRTFRDGVPYYMGDSLPPLTFTVDDRHKEVTGVPGVNRAYGNLIAWQRPAVIQPAFRAHSVAGGADAELLTSNGAGTKERGPSEQAVDEALPREIHPSGMRSVQNAELRLIGWQLSPCEGIIVNPLTPTLCKVEMRVSIRDRPFLADLGDIEVLPGAPHRLELDANAETDQNAEVTAALSGSVPPIGIKVLDRFGQPTRRYKSRTPNASVSVEITPVARFTLRGTRSKCPEGTACRALFDDLEVTPRVAVPRGGLLATLTFTLAGSESTVTVRLRILPPRTPHHFELTRADARVNHVRANGADVFTVEDFAGSQIDNLRLKVFNVSRLESLTPPALAPRRSHSLVC